MQLQPLGIEDEEIALQAGERHHALDDEFGQLDEQAGGADFLDQRLERGALGGVGLAVEVFELLELHRFLLGLGGGAFGVGKMQREPGEAVVAEVARRRGRGRKGRDGRRGPSSGGWAR